MTTINDRNTIAAIKSYLYLEGDINRTIEQLQNVTMYGYCDLTDEQIKEVARCEQRLAILETRLKQKVVISAETLNIGQYDFIGLVNKYAESKAN